jgi:hypothetical protein
MVAPLGALLAGSAAATTEVEEDIDGGLCGEGGGGLPVGPAAATTEVKDDVDGGPLDRDPGAPTINNVKNVDNGTPGRCQSWRSGSVHHQC